MPLSTRDRGRLTAIVTVADDGGSSGRLRRALGVLPPGDVRNCLLALADGPPAVSEVFRYRFPGGDELAGHSLGNLILAALTHLEGGFPEAVDRAGRLLGTRGRVLPATPDEIVLEAELADGTRVAGESAIAAAGAPVRRLGLRPPAPRALPEAVEAIERAGLVVIGPGSLYTSLIPVLLVPGIAGALARSRARVALVANLMTQPGETDGYGLADHVAAIRRHAPGVPLHDVVLNTAPLPADRLAPYRDQGAVPVPMDAAAARALGCRPLGRPLLGPGRHVRHDPGLLARAVLELATEVSA
jgi:uncharacterized cofD-like protein